MSEITLQAGQVWVPTKGRKIGRVVLFGASVDPQCHLHYHTTNNTKTVWCWPNDFRAWITRTGAVLREEAP